MTPDRLPPTDDDAPSALVADVLARRRLDDSASAAEYGDRRPALRESLAHLVSRQDFLHSAGAESGVARSHLRLPDVGDEVFGFRLRAELGKGAFARVFLAEQAALGGRAVAVKISAIEGGEPQTLAQMQHTHIVPIYAVHEDPRSGLRAVCMPYFGGASLARVSAELWAGAAPPTTGRQFADALTAVQSAPPPADSGGQTPLAALRRESFCRAVMWVAARLAEGLHHAHQRRVLHRDIKPANILLGADGQPMLLDFNLAQDLGQTAVQAVLGGTVAYMAPEHLRAMARRTPALVKGVDHRSDIYSLGMVLYETLTGARPFEHSGSYSVTPLHIEAMATDRDKAAPSLRARRPDASWGLESVVRKCLAPDPAARYQQAEDLAEDLRRLLDHRPLAHAPELSRRERVAKWARRHPRLTVAGGAAVVVGGVLLAGGAALVTTRDHLAGARHQLGTAAGADRRRAFDAGTVRALCLVNTTTGLRDHLPAGLRACEETLDIYGLRAAGRWEEPADWAGLPPAERAGLAEDARELLLLLADGRVRLAAADPAALRAALATLDRAEAIPAAAPSRALWLDRARYWDALGAAREAGAARERAAQTPVASARDHYLMAVALLRAGRGTTTGPSPRWTGPSPSTRGTTGRGCCAASATWTAATGPWPRGTSAGARACGRRSRGGTSTSAWRRPRTGTRPRRRPVTTRPWNATPPCCRPA